MTRGFMPGGFASSRPSSTRRTLRIEYETDMFRSPVADRAPRSIGDHAGSLRVATCLQIVAKLAKPGAQLRDLLGDQLVEAMAGAHDRHLDFRQVRLERRPALAELHAAEVKLEP